MDKRTDHLWALVLAGGDGTRLQGLTRLIAGAPIPKQYCRILGDRSLLETTLARVARLVPCERTLAIDAGLGHLPEIADGDAARAARLPVPGLVRGRGAPPDAPPRLTARAPHRHVVAAW